MPFSVTHTFVDGTLAIASEVNTNFNNVEAELNDFPTDGALGSGVVDTTQLAADAVDGTKVADDAIDSEHYTDGSIDTAHLADDAVTSAKIVNISPAAAASDTQSCTLVNGMIFKFGEESVAGNTTDEVTYGTAFTNGIYTTVCSYKSTNAALSECAVCQPKSGSETSILQVTNGMNATYTISWIAIGY